ncbi:VOC family protein [Sulfurovum sp.]|uniref:VOC family protein n=1 Tax=Sulfurovum sp. TaxID=1969726 RepID=UPI00286827C6|nr:VOC family protein [Sulfurovum sp.]
MQRKYFTQALLIGLASLWFTGCTSMPLLSQKSEPLLLPSVTSTVTGERHPGKFIWHDLLTDDVVSSRKFYAGVFGWTFKTKGSYVQILNQGNIIGGMMHVRPAVDSKAEAVWLPSLSVSDVDQSIRYLKSKKGKVLQGPLDMNERGRGVLVSDSQGAQLVLLHTKDGDPKDVTPQTGDWLWNELWTNTPKESYSFYRKLGGYDSSEIKNGYGLLRHKGKWRAGIRDVSKDDLKSRWVPTIRVSDLEETMRKVSALGGKVLVSPDKELVDGNVALISDNTGALVIIQHWEKGGTE